MAKLFNSEFEVSLRALLLLAECKARGMSVDRLAAYDFIAIYGRYFGISEVNLHGENSFSFGELASRRTLMQNALKELVLEGLAYVSKSKNGFLYFISPKGISLCKNMNTDYAETYRQLVKKAVAKYDNQSEVQILNAINRKSTETLRRRSDG